MKVKTLISIIACTAISLSAVLVLYKLSDHVVHSPGGFYRIMPPHPVIPLNSMELRFPSYYIAGATQQKIILGDRTSPLNALVLNADLTDSMTVRLKLKGVDRLKFYRAIVKIDSPYFFLADGSIPFIYRGNLADWQGERIDRKTIYFQDLVPLGEDRFAIRSYSLSKKENVLGHLSLDTTRVKFDYTLLTKQIDGIFCTDGMLQFDNATRRIVYLYFYRNQYIVTDDQLGLEFRGTTIDTFSIAKVKSASIALAGKVSSRLAGPPPTVNRHSCVYENWLFVHSNILSNNEDVTVFSRTSVIDVYSLGTRKYLFSFYVPDRNHDKMRGLTVVNRRLFVLYESFIDSYQLNKDYFKSTAFRRGFAD